MKKLTKGQRFALAREARRLAMECAVGKPPRTLQRFYTFNWDGRGIPRGPCCAIGHVLWRAAGGARHTALGLYEDSYIPTRVNQANENAEPLSERASRLVFPLLEWADELEASAASVPQAPPEVP